MPVPYCDFDTDTNPNYSVVTFYDIEGVDSLLYESVTVLNSSARQISLAKDETYVEVFFSTMEKYQLVADAIAPIDTRSLRVKNVNGVLMNTNADLYAALVTLMGSSNEASARQTDVQNAVSNGQTVFTLTTDAKTGFEYLSSLFINNGVYTYGADFTIAGDTLTYTGSYSIQIGDRVTVIYPY